MSKFIDNLFSLKDAYSFGELPEFTLRDHVIQELSYQLKNLELLWMSLDPELWNNAQAFYSNVKYQCCLERLSFRLSEILRVIESFHGPRIVRFVSSEIRDLIEEKRYMEHYFTPQEVDQVSIILTVMNSYFQAEVVELQLITREEIAEQLKRAMIPLLKHI